MILSPPITIRPVEHSAGTARPVTFEIAPLPLSRIQVLLVDRSMRYLRVSITLFVDKTEEGHWLVTHPEIMTHGVGDTPEAAVKDFESMLIDLFRELVESENVLADHLRKELKHLRTLLVERNLL